MEAMTMLLRLILACITSCVVATNAYGQPVAKPRLDSLGDPLPEGAIARLGTSKMRLFGTMGIGKVMFSADGKKALSSNFQPNGLTVWDMASGRPCSQLDGLQDKRTQHAMLSSDGTLLVAQVGSLVAVWDTESGKKLAQFKDESFAHVGFAFEDNRELVRVTATGKVEWWDIAKEIVVRTWDCLAALQKPKDFSSPLNSICTAAFLENGRVLVTHLGHTFKDEQSSGWVSDPVVVAWDIATGKELW